MSAHLPPVAPGEYRDFRADTGRWKPALAAIAETNGLGGRPLREISSGSNLIAFVGDDLVLKVFPPFLHHQFQSERAALRHLRGGLSVPIPGIVVEGNAAGWSYLVMTRLPGVELGTIWDGLGEREKNEILFSIGELIAEIQSRPPGELTALEPRWNDFIAGQALQCKDRHARLGLPPVLLADIDRFLAATSGVIPESCPRVILTGEYSPENLLVSRRAGAWHLSGLVDFGDVMTGCSEYDLLGPGTFLAAGHRTRLRALLTGFGYTERDLVPELARRLMRMHLLHRYSNFGEQVRIYGWENRAGNLDELQQLVWPLA